MQGTKRQHTVAQSYLKRFTPDGARLFAFDKTNGKVFRTNVVNVAQEAFFYELPPEIMDKAAAELGVKDQYLEKILADADGYAKRQIDEILDSIERNPISRHHRLALATVIALQFSRTVLNRQLVKECYEKVAKAAAEEMIRLKDPEVAKECGVEVEFAESTWVMQQARQFLDEEHMVRLTSVLDSHIWVFGINNSIQPFYTSDHPVVKTAHCTSGGIELTGLEAPGIEIVFPLSSRYVLYMVERSHFRHMERLDGQARPLDPFDVEHFNMLQVRKSYRQVYCEKDEFDQARGTCRRYPECCDPNRSRVEVVQSGNYLLTLFRE